MKLNKEEVVLLIDLLEEHKLLALTDDPEIINLDEKLKAYLVKLTA